MLGGGKHMNIKGSRKINCNNDKIQFARNLLGNKMQIMNLKWNNKALRLAEIWKSASFEQMLILTHWIRFNFAITCILHRHQPKISWVS